MKSSVRSFVSGILVTLAFFSMIGTAFATKGKRAVDIDYNDIQVTLDGQTVALVDANGNPVEPFAIDGTTYLPVRAVANALGLEVGWDQETSTVVLNTETTKPQRNGFNSATNQSIKVGSYTYSIPNYFVQSDDGSYYDDKGALLLLYSDEFVGSDKVSLQELLAIEDKLMAMLRDMEEVDSCTVAEGEIIRTKNDDAGILWDFSIIYSDDILTSATGLFFVFADGHSMSGGVLIAFDISEYSYSNDFSKIISSVKKETQSNLTTDTTSSTPVTDSPFTPSTKGSKNDDGDMPNGSQMVYFTATGKRYHYDSTCNGGRYSLTTLEDAKRRGLSPCEKCVLH